MSKEQGFALPFITAFLIALLSACASTHTMNVPTGFVAANPSLFQIQDVPNKVACLVISPELRDYQFTKSAYSWAGGNLFPDTLIFNLGNTFVGEIRELVRVLFRASLEVTTLADARNLPIAVADIIIVPRIIGSSLELPVVRLGTITATFQVEYNIYEKNGTLISSREITGSGQKRLVLTKENYILAFEEAVRDTMQKSKQIVLSQAD